MNLKNNEYARQRVLALQLQRGSRRALPTERARPIAKHRLVVADLLHTRHCHGVSSSDGHSVRAGRSMERAEDMERRGYSEVHTRIKSAIHRVCVFVWPLMSEAISD